MVLLHMPLLSSESISQLINQSVNQSIIQSIINRGKRDRLNLRTGTIADKFR